MGVMILTEHVAMPVNFQKRNGRSSYKLWQARRKHFKGGQATSRQSYLGGHMHRPASIFAIQRMARPNYLVRPYPGKPGLFHQAYACIGKLGLLSGWPAATYTPNSLPNTYNYRHAKPPCLLRNSGVFTPRPTRTCASVNFAYALVNYSQTCSLVADGMN